MNENPKKIKRMIIAVDEELCIEWVGVSILPNECLRVSG